MYMFLRNNVEHYYNFNKNILVTIILVLFIRLLLKKSPKKYTYYLWFVVIIRMLFPISIKSIFSIYNAEKIITPIINNTTINKIINITQPQYYTNALNVYKELNGYGYGTIPGYEIVRESSHADIGVLWLFGLAALIAYSIGTYIDVKKDCKTAIKLKDNIYQSDKFSSPFVIGYIQSKIIIPFNLDEQSQRIIIEHEQLHLKRKDNITRLLFYILAIFYWMNPFVWVAYHLFIKDMEMSCDEYVLSNKKEDNKTYSYTLVSIASNQKIVMPKPLAFGENSIKERIKNILSWKEPNKKKIIFGLLLSVYCLVAFTTDPTDQKKVMDLINENTNNIKKVIVENEKTNDIQNEYTIEFDSWIQLRDIKKILNSIEISNLKIDSKRNQILTTLTIFDEHSNKIELYFTENYDECILNVNGNKTTYKVKNTEFTKETLQTVINYRTISFDAGLLNEDIPNSYYDLSEIKIFAKKIIDEHVSESQSSISITIENGYYGFRTNHIIEKDKITFISLDDENILVFNINEIDGKYELIFNESESYVIYDDLLERLRILNFKEDMWY